MNLTTHIWDQYQASFFPAQNVNGPCECCCFLWLQKEQSNAESLKVFLLTSFKFTKLSLSNPTSNLCLFNCKTLRYWFILVWCSMNSVNINAHHTSWTNTLLTYIQGSKKLRLRQNAIRCRHGTWGRFWGSDLQAPNLSTFETREWRDILISYWYLKRSCVPNLLWSDKATDTKKSEGSL